MLLSDVVFQCAVGAGRTMRRHLVHHMVYRVVGPATRHVARRLIAHHPSLAGVACHWVPIMVVAAIGAAAPVSFAAAHHPLPSPAGPLAGVVTAQPAAGSSDYSGGQGLGPDMGNVGWGGGGGDTAQGEDMLQGATVTPNSIGSQPSEWQFPTPPIMAAAPAVEYPDATPPGVTAAPQPAMPQRAAPIMPAVSARAGVTDVPEPSSALLLSASVLALLLLSRGGAQECRARSQ